MTPAEETDPTAVVCDVLSEVEEGDMTPDAARDYNIPALTIWNPWAHAIAHLGKTIENRSWLSYHRGLLAIHAAANAGTRYDQAYAIDKAAALAGVPRRAVKRGMQVRGAVVAVARLTGVCYASLYYPPGRPLHCDCGPWAFSGSMHFQLADVRALREPVPCRGAQKLWSLPDDVYEAVLPTAEAVLRG